jgi:hypothetical protein
MSSGLDIVTSVFEAQSHAGKLARWMPRCSQCLECAHMFLILHPRVERTSVHFMVRNTYIPDWVLQHPSLSGPTRQGPVRGVCLVNV